MKQVRDISLFLLVVLLNASFTLRYDDGEGVQREDLLTVWECIIDEGYEKYDSRPHWDEEWNDTNPNEIQFMAEFNSNGTIRADNRSFVWTLRSNVLELTYTDGESFIAEILKLTSSELIMERFETETDEFGKSTFWNKRTFKKVE